MIYPIKAHQVQVAIRWCKTASVDSQSTSTSLLFSPTVISPSMDEYVVSVHEAQLPELELTLSKYDEWLLGIFGEIGD